MTAATTRERCPICDFPLATSGDIAVEGLCRASTQFLVPRHGGPAIDWRARALEAEKELLRVMDSVQLVPDAEQAFIDGLSARAEEQEARAVAAEAHAQEARESEARMRAVVQSQFSAILLSTTDPTVRGMVTTFRAALSAPAPEPSERMMRVAEAVWCNAKCLDEDEVGVVEREHLRAIVAKVTP